MIHKTQHYTIKTDLATQRQRFVGVFNEKEWKMHESQKTVHKYWGIDETK